MNKRQAKRPAFSPAEQKRIITALKQFEQTGSRQRTKQIRALLRDYVNFVILTGARPGTELSNLCWKDIERITVNKKKYLAITVNGKTGERELIASIELQQYLDRLKKRNTGCWTSKNKFVFVLPDGTKPKDLHGSFETLLISLNLLTNKQGKRYSLYSLRHSYATQKLMEGVHMHSLARQMGTSTKMLEDFYSKVTARMNAKQFG